MRTELEPERGYTKLELRKRRGPKDRCDSTQGVKFFSWASVGVVVSFVVGRARAARAAGSTCAVLDNETPLCVWPRFDGPCGSALLRKWSALEVHWSGSENALLNFVTPSESARSPGSDVAWTNGRAVMHTLPAPGYGTLNVYKGAVRTSLCTAPKSNGIDSF